MPRNWMAMLVVAGGLESGMFGQQYPPNQGDQGDDAYYGNGHGVYAPAPPPMPYYACQRSPMPGPGYYWVDGYWDFLGGRYRWVGGYWMFPPYAGGSWMPPRYFGGRFYLGFWGGRGYVRDDYRHQFRPNYGGQAQREYGFRGGNGNQSGHRGGKNKHGGRSENSGHGNSRR